MSKSMTIWAYRVTGVHDNDEWELIMIPKVPAKSPREVAEVVASYFDYIEAGYPIAGSDIDWTIHVRREKAPATEYDFLVRGRIVYTATPYPEGE